MVHLHVALEPHVGTPIVARAEAEAARLAKKAKKNGDLEPFECHLADAYAALLSGSGKGRARRPELVVLVSHEVARRGWTDVREGEVCKIPGIGPVSPQVAREIASDAFLNGVFYDGTDLRQFRRWSRAIPVEVAIALELGEPPSFDGVRCVDCGNSFRTEFDHVQPHAAKGPTSIGNLKSRCWSCHQAKTASDRKKRKAQVGRTLTEPAAVGVGVAWWLPSEKSGEPELGPKRHTRHESNCARHPCGSRCAPWGLQCSGIASELLMAYLRCAGVCPHRGDGHRQRGVGAHLPGARRLVPA
jgi:5-methylcytosine-specific restriction endonuclease McrA